VAIPMPGPIALPGRASAPAPGSIPLPRRRPGEQLPLSVRRSSSEPTNTGSWSVMPPVPAPRRAADDGPGAVTVGLDPEKIRARLSAFAEGVSAASRHGDGAAQVPPKER
jgi:hypothetical protein